MIQAKIDVVDITFKKKAVLNLTVFSAPVARFPRAGPGSSSALNAPAGSPVPRLSRRSRAPSAPINRVEKSTLNFNIAKKKNRLKADSLFKDYHQMIVVNVNIATKPTNNPENRNSFGASCPLWLICIK